MDALALALALEIAWGFSPTKNVALRGASLSAEGRSEARRAKRPYYCRCFCFCRCFYRCFCFCVAGASRRARREIWPPGAGGSPSPRHNIENDENHKSSLITPIPPTTYKLIPSKQPKNRLSSPKTAQLKQNKRDPSGILVTLNPLYLSIESKKTNKPGSQPG